MYTYFFIPLPPGFAHASTCFVTQRFPGIAHAASADVTVAAAVGGGALMLRCLRIAFSLASVFCAWALRIWISPNNCSARLICPVSRHQQNS